MAQQNLATDEAGNVWDMSSGRPRFVSGPQQSIQTKPADRKLPGELEGLGLNNRGQALSNAEKGATLPLVVPKAKADLTNTQVNIEQGKAGIVNQRAQRLQSIRQEFNALPEVKTYSEALQALTGAMKAPKGPQGDLAVIYAFAKAMDPGSVVREGEMEMANSTASVIAQLKQQYKGFASGHGLPPEVRTGLVEAARQKIGGMKSLYAQQYERYAEEAKKQGFNPIDVVGKPLPEAVRPIEEEYIKAHGGTPRSLATGATRNVDDPETTKQMDAAIRAGLSYEQASAMAQAAGYPPPDKATYNEAVAYAKKNPGYKGSLADATRTVPNVAADHPFAVDPQIAAGPLGAALSGMAKAGTMGTIDNLVGAVGGDAAGFRAGQDALAQAQPIADLAGQALGGAATGMGISAGLSRVPGMAGGMFGSRVAPNLLSREGVVGDTLYGAGYGAGSEDDNHLQGALAGGLTGLGGGIAARGAVSGLASAVSPTGGAMRPLYDMGVRPSIGQRLGGVANTLEEKFQSIPLVGDAIKGTRDRARDQYQIGLFNDSLSHLNLRLPKSMRPGHEPHAFSQDAISNAYDSALGNMSAAADAHLGQDIGALQQKIGTLRPDSQAQFNKIWADSVARRFQNGQLAGPAYKQAESELGKRVAAIRKNPTGDHELASALEDALGALRGSALRNSPPDAVAALNAADAAHAKIVRIEEASRKAGEPAEFSPTQYNTAVKTSSGGVRNRNYLRGDALNTDLAALGTRLGDKVSNSGTVDRLAAGGALFGLGAIHPGVAAAFGGLGAINAPGIRNVTTELMAPRANPIFDRAADQLRQRARLAGMFGAPLALNYYGQ